MSTGKRKFADFDGEARGHGKDRSRGPASVGPSSKKSKVHKAKPDNMPWVKKRARTIERLLRTSQDLPANVQNDLERELEHHRSRIAKAAEDKQRKDMISKYHMVRFFERKKADRLAKRLRTQLDATEDEAEKKKIAADLRTAEIDGVYARFFPHRERYISLYPVAGSGTEEDEKVDTKTTGKAVKALKVERPPIWYDIERAERKGMSALVAIRERNLNATPAKGANSTELPSRSSTKQGGDRPGQDSNAAGAAAKRKGKGKHDKLSGAEVQAAAEDSDSDGGFFE
ncbi:uncharacterized protein B0I36DRAFT_380985 [Microdochium trichocladiopsis]|uniref:rRNA-processing protein EFG1 n=1 Tax=Microdochium trichocladiopsis TaxID=1682393 RepID=A0A9P9BUV5_9PEZI|nr:uncharacterized protein B0I36DRAFT_380985 [Microdochium trichocladiopsis]KAH7037859.1 hypothetical protein B0I36DRAFT_380985 [Microdochium trichocladiopsis]